MLLPSRLIYCHAIRNEVNRQLADSPAQAENLTRRWVDVYLSKGKYVCSCCKRGWTAQTAVTVRFDIKLKRAKVAIRYQSGCNKCKRVCSPRRMRPAERKWVAARAIRLATRQRVERQPGVDNDRNHERTLCYFPRCRICKQKPTN